MHAINVFITREREYDGSRDRGVRMEGMEFGIALTIRGSEGNAYIVHRL
jgi:hypothetical protein